MLFNVSAVDVYGDHALIKNRVYARNVKALIGISQRK
jgi:hypothetical protein